MSDLSKIITLVELLAVAAFTCYVGTMLWPLSVIAAIIFFLLTCLPAYAIICALFTDKQLIKAPMEELVPNLIVIFVAISQLSKAPEIAALTYSAVTLAAIDLCSNILNLVSPQKEFLTYKNATIRKTAGVLAVTEWILMAALCIIVGLLFWGETWWITPIAVVVLALLGYLCALKRNNPSSSAPIGGIILDLTVLAFLTIVYLEDTSDNRAITLCLLLTVAVDLTRCLLRKTCTITSLNEY